MGIAASPLALRFGGGGALRDAHCHLQIVIRHGVGPPDLSLVKALALRLDQLEAVDCGTAPVAPLQIDVARHRSIKNVNGRQRI